MYEVNIYSLQNLQHSLNAMSAEGWTLLFLMPHPFDTIDGEVEFIAIWNK